MPQQRVFVIPSYHCDVVWRREPQEQIRIRQHQYDAALAAQATALNMHALLGLRDLSRTDLIVDADGVAWFLEVNVAPGMTETSLFPQALLAAELSPGEIAAGLVEAAVARGA